MMRKPILSSVLAGAIVSILSAAFAIEVREEPTGYELWGMRPKHPAVVNPVLGSDPAITLDLGGDWEFVHHPKYVPERTAFWGVFPTAENWGATKTARIPATLETQGFGEPGDMRPWDCTWDASTKPIRHVFTGSGWYRRKFRIPSGWTGKRVWLKVGDVRSQGWFWVNGTQVAWHEAFCGTYKYEITDLVKPGEEALFVIQVSNEVASRAGSRSSQNRWCGVLRALELEATPDVFIDDAWARGDFDQRAAEVNVKLDGVATVKSVGGLRLKVDVEGEVVQTPLTANRQSLTVKIPLRAFRPWSPESPNLYTAKVELVSGGKVIQTRRERFGVRKIEVRGGDFYLNGRPFFFRGVGYHNDQPIHGHDLIGDRDCRREAVRKLQAAGFNSCRLHTRCETPEFFDACDELGFLVQPELPYYTDIPCERFEFNPIRDAKELYVHFRRHPSFAVYSHGNEGGFGPALAKLLYRMIKAMDPDRLVIEQDSDQWGKIVGAPPCAKLLNLPEASDYVGGPATEWPRGSAVTDRPMVCHEYLNLSVKANPELEDKYTGIWQVPYTRKQRAEWLAKSGLTDFWGTRLIFAQYRLQAYWLKHGIEAARSDPYCDGYHYWCAQDVTVRNGECFAALGVYDSFWGEKPGGTSPAEARLFNSADCLLCDSLPAARIAESGQAVTNTIGFAHYSDKDITDGRLVWRLVTADGRELVRGGRQLGAVAPGGVRWFAPAVLTVPDLTQAVRAKFEVSLSESVNAWDFWLFPKRGAVRADGVGFAPELAALAARYVGTAAPESAKVVVAPTGSMTAKAARERGATLVAIGPADGAPAVKLGWWWMGATVGAVFADDPALAGLPHSGVLDGLFMRILKKGKPLPLEGFTERELLAVGEGKDACTCYLARRDVNGRREYMLHGLDVLSRLPESEALLDGIILDASGKK